MNIEDFRKYCLSLPYTEERMPFEKFFRGKHSFLAFYVQWKMFCYFDIDRFDQCTIKCPPKAIEDLETNYQSVMRPYNLSPRNWISVCFNRDVPDDKIKELDTYHDIKAEFLQLYLNEFCYKFNRRYFGFRLFDRLELCACSYRADFKHRIY